MENNDLTKWEEERIKQKIHFENETRKVLNIEGERIKDILKPFKGLKVLNMDTTLSKRIKDLIVFKEWEIKPLKDGDKATLRIYLESSQYSLMIKSSICFNGGSYDNKTYYCVYYEGYKYVAKIKGSILTELEEIQQLPLLDVNYQLEQFKKVKEIKAQLEKEEDKLFYAVKENNLNR